MAKEVKEVIVPMGAKDPKKHVVKYSADGDAAVGSVYVSNEAIQSLGDPDEIEVIVRAI